MLFRKIEQTFFEDFEVSGISSGILYPNARRYVCPNAGRYTFLYTDILY